MMEWMSMMQSKEGEGAEPRILPTPGSSPWMSSFVAARCTPSYGWTEHAVPGCID